MTALAEALLVLLPLWLQTFGLSLTQTGALKEPVLRRDDGRSDPFGSDIGAVRRNAGCSLSARSGPRSAGCCWPRRMDSVPCASRCWWPESARGVQHPLASSLVSRAYRGERVRAALGVYNFAGDAGKAVVSCPSCGRHRARRLEDVVDIVRHRDGGSRTGGCISRCSGSCPTRSRPNPATAAPSGWGIVNRRDFTLLSAIAIIDASSRAGFLLLAPFLMIEKGLPVEHVGYGIMLIFAGGAAGKFACGFIAERLGTIRTIVITELATGLGVAAGRRRADGRALGAARANRPRAQRDVVRIVRGRRGARA